MHLALIEKLFSAGSAQKPKQHRSCDVTHHDVLQYPLLDNSRTPLGD